MRAPVYRAMLRLPDPMRSWEESLEVYNLDLGGLSLSELLGEEQRAARLAAMWPDRFLYRGSKAITVRRWAEERVAVCERRKFELLGWDKPSAPKHGPRVRPWT